MTARAIEQVHGSFGASVAASPGAAMQWRMAIGIAVQSKYLPLLPEMQKNAALLLPLFVWPAVTKVFLVRCD